MMKSILLSGLAILLCAFSYAQEEFDGDIRWGEEFLIKRKETGPNPVGTADGNFYSTKGKKSKVYLQTFDLKSLSLEKEDELNLRYKEFPLKIVNSFVFGEKVVFITSYIDKPRAKQFYLMHEYKGGTELGTPIQLAEVAWSKKKVILTKKAMEKIKNSGAYSFDFVTSDDMETMMVKYREEGSDDILTVLIDKDMNEVSRATMEIPYETFTVVTGRLSNTGRMYAVGYESTTETTDGLIKREYKTAGKYHILIYDAVEGDVEEFDLETEEDIVSVNLKILEDESFVVYGMHSKEDAKGVSGAFFIKMDAKRNQEYSTFDTFEEDFITQHWTPRQKKKAEKKKKKNNKKKQEPSLFSYIMHDLVIKENGEMVLLAEQYYMYVTSHTYTDANGVSHTTYTYHYIYNDIIAVNCTPDGEVTWKEKVKKRQHTTNDNGYYSSFFTMVQENNVFMIYNDKEANMDDAEETRGKAKRNTVAAIITLTEDGEMKRETLFDYEGEESRTLVPKRCAKMGEGEIMLYTNSSRRGKILGWVTL